MKRILTFITFVVVFSFSMFVDAQDAPSDASADTAAEAGTAGSSYKDDNKPEFDWKWDGNVDVRMNRYNGADDISNMFYRGMLGAKVSHDTLHGYVSVYGVNESPYTIGTAPITTTAANVNARASVNLYKAYLKWVPTETLRVKAGIFGTSFFGYTNEYKANPDALNGLYVKYKTDVANISALYAVRYDMGLTGVGANETDTQLSYTGVNVKLAQLPEFLTKVKLGYYMQNGSQEVAAATNEPTLNSINMYGATVKGGMAGLKIKGSYYLQSGDGVVGEDSSSMMGVKASYNLPETMNATVWGAYHQDSSNYVPFFYNEHRNAGYSDIFRWGNLTYISIGAKVVPTEGVHLGAGYHMFTKTDAAANTNYLNYGSHPSPGRDQNRQILSNSPTPVQDDDLGSELDVWVKKKFDNGLAAKLRYAKFTPGAAYNTEDDYNTVELRLVADF